MMYKIHGAVQNYAWGGYEYIPRLLQQPASAKPVAELWFGDHLQAPSLIETQEGLQPLNHWLTTHYSEVLSAHSRRCYGNKLPYLLKILDVRLPLSIQLHPNKAQAEAGFAKEEAAGIARNAPQRTYQDDNHKPEMMIALSEFWLLHGFTDRDAIIRRLHKHPSLAPVAAIVEQHNLHDAYARIMTASREELTKWLLPILQQPAPEQVSADPDYWLHGTVKAMGIDPEAPDPGLLSFYLFNIVKMNAGEGIFQPACLPHAYLRGQNIEIMSASNNVLRAGLTPKHIDIPELLRIIDSRSITPKIIASAPEIGGGLYYYPAPVNDFVQQTVHFRDGETLTCRHAEATIVLNLSHVLNIRSETQTAELHSGEAVLISAGSHISYQATGNCYTVFSTNQ